MVAIYNTNIVTIYDTECDHVASDVYIYISTMICNDDCNVFGHT